MSAGPWVNRNRVLIREWGDYLDALEADEGAPLRAVVERFVANPATLPVDERLTEWAGPKTRRPCGTDAAYRRGCRCQPCRDAHSVAARRHGLEA